MKAHATAWVIGAVLLLAGGPLLGQEGGGDAPAPPENLRVKNVSDYAETKIRLRWDHGEGGGRSAYEVQRSTSVTGEFSKIATLPPVATEHIDVVDSTTRAEEKERARREGRDISVDDAPLYSYRVIAVAEDGSRSSAAQTTEGIQATRGVISRFQRFTSGLFDWSRGWFLIVTLLICASVIYFIFQARTGKPLKIRKIAGLEAVDEAVGRATEMGRSCLFIPGIQDMNEIQTIAGITILARVSRTAADFDAKVEVPTARSLVMTTARETVQAAFLAAGRPDAYNEDLIYYVTDEQFGYVAYLSGMMVREKPAACFYMGAFFAESLILAETGNSIGAIQIAGTAMPAQLPFFVAACDYTLIGEEFFAASAYLSGSPEELGSLKGQDVGKVMVAAVLVIGCVISTIASVADSEALRDAVQFITQTLLT
ncbi:MAG: DUF6754 domain-containing protein [Planctomycetota bacterium]